MTLLDPESISDVCIRYNGITDVSVRLAGREISQALIGFSIENTAGNMPLLVLQIPLMEYSFEGESRVHMNPSTKETLIKLGWLPPLEGDISNEEPRGDSSKG